MQEDHTFQPDWEIRIRPTWPRRLISFADRAPAGRQIRGNAVADVHTVGDVREGGAVGRAGGESLRIRKAGRADRVDEG